MSSQPDPPQLKEMERQAQGFAREAGRILLDYFQKPLAVEFTGKDKRHPVTPADHAAQDYLKQAVSEAYPDHGFMAEESDEGGTTDSEFLWVADPLDGTTNFINGLPVFAVSLGVLYRGQPVIGCIYAPAMPGPKGELFHAYRGGGAFLEDQPLSVFPNLSQEKLASLPSGFSGFIRPAAELRKKLGEPRSLGSIAYDLALVARGTFHFAYFGSPRLWDLAAGAVLVREAGGEVLIRERPQGWQALQAFQPPAKKDSKGLRDWCSSTILACPEAAWLLARNLKGRCRVSRLLARWL